ncbi:hypothetical protein [Lacihabitans soyangensis]|uniref:Uncharacterized protein n=1 Tax=Lacihabitans soyangensis TaxID=869394 RepID=A0AAE3KW10_9BACT|nr:hypothetical protein [Lacihabitans soyangensis]MCP9764856.1 hypothetical protein [Lacihabitans soyangensis]
MKLTDSQIAEIEKYFNSCELTFKEFYDEMFDHFCSEIEYKMNESKSFEESFNEVHENFNSYKQKVRLGEISEFYGLKALEYQQAMYFDRNIKIEYFKNLANNFLTSKILIWLLIGLLIFKFLPYATINFKLNSLGSFTQGFSIPLNIFLAAFIIEKANLVEAFKHSTLGSLFSTKRRVFTDYSLKTVSVFKIVLIPISALIFIIQFVTLFEIQMDKVSQSIVFTLTILMLSTTLNFFIEKKILNFKIFKA